MIKTLATHFDWQFPVSTFQMSSETARRMKRFLAFFTILKLRKKKIKLLRYCLEYHRFSIQLSK